MTPRVKDPGQPSESDRRSTRWSVHRESRRVQLVEAAVAAIDQHGPSAGLGDIAAEAGVSKPVLYRYFADKDEIHTAVGQWGAQLVMDRLLPALVGSGPIRERVAQAVDAYLGAIEEHPNVFLLLMRHRSAGAADPIADGKATIAAVIARVMGEALRELGVDAGGAEPWAHGLVGLGLSTGEWWLDRQTMTRAHVGAYLTDFVWHALRGISAGYGVDIESQAGLRLLAGGGEVPEAGSAP